MPRIHPVSSVREVPDSVARFLLDSAPGPGAWLLLLPGFEAATAVREAMGRQAKGRGLASVAAPRFATLDSLVEAVATDRAVTPRARRLADLRHVLAARGWFDGVPSWDACHAILELADELSARLPEPPDEGAFLRMIESHYRGRAARLAEPEARLIHEVWRAYARPVRGAALDPGMAWRMRLGEAARACDRPLAWLSARPGAPLEPHEHTFIDLVEARHPVHVFAPENLTAALSLAWPEEVLTPVDERAGKLAAEGRATLERITVMRSASLEAEASVAAGQVRRWLADGRERIAIVAQDRVATRRVRALLERDGVLLADEAGWKLSTTRAATCAMRWIEVVAGGFGQRDLLDWMRSPFAFADLAPNTREAAVAVLDTAVRRHNVQAGLPAIRRAVAMNGVVNPDLISILERLETAARVWDRRLAPLATWFDLLGRSLSILGASDALAADAAGAPLIDRISALREQMAGAAPVSLMVWRDFFAAELELESFRDDAIDSPVIVTSLKRVALRRFDAVLLVGGGEAHLTLDESAGLLFGERLRAQLGLATPNERSRVLRDAIAAAIDAGDVFCATWMAGGERDPQRLSTWLARVDTLARAAGMAGRVHHATLSRPGRVPGLATSAPAPSAPALLPVAVSASAYASLIDCPYQFFARHMLGLNERDEVREEFEKRDYGSWVHALLHTLHARVPVFLDVTADEALVAFRESADAVFAEPIAFNYLSLGWKARLLRIAPTYVEWQRERERDGWRWERGEWRCEAPVTLASGAQVRIVGRLDRVDRKGQDTIAILDYKTQSVERLRQKVKEAGEDVQLAVYGLLHPQGEYAEAVYVPLDGDRIEGVKAHADHSVASERERVSALFSAIESGASLPANAPDSACARCEMRGLCRRDHWGADDGHG